MYLLAAQVNLNWAGFGLLQAASLWPKNQPRNRLNEAK